MVTLTLRLPDSLHRKLKKFAADEDVSINQFIATAVAEKMSALMTESYIQERAAKGSRAKFDRVLKKVKSREAVKGDE